MRKLTLLCLGLWTLAVTGCRKDDLPITDVFSEIAFDKTQIEADGQSTFNAAVELQGDVSADRRNVVFKVSGGTFVAGGTVKITAKAEYEQGKLIAKTAIKTSTNPSTITVTVEPEYDSRAQTFQLSKSLVSTRSEPKSIKIESSVYGIASNFFTEALLTVSLKNADGKFVSSGYKILIEDELGIGMTAMGRYRRLLTETADSSKVTGFYSCPAYPISTNIKIRATLLDANGTKTSLKDSLFLTTNL